MENVHKDIDEVKRFSILPKNNPERRIIIDILRKKFKFHFNTNSSLNDGKLIVCRRPQGTLKKNPSDFQACPNCKGFFLKNNIRHHAKQCYIMVIIIEHS